MNLLDVLKENKVVIATTLAVLTVLGGSAVIELPADRKVAALELKVAQYQQMDDERYQRQRAQEINQDLKYVSDKINQLNQQKQFRPLTPEEEWLQEQYRQDFQRLKEEEYANDQD